MRRHIAILQRRLRRRIDAACEAARIRSVRPQAWWQLIRSAWKEIRLHIAVLTRRLRRTINAACEAVMIRGVRPHARWQIIRRVWHNTSDIQPEPQVPRYKTAKEIRRERYRAERIGIIRPLLRLRERCSVTWAILLALAIAVGFTVVCGFVGVIWPEKNPSSSQGSLLMSAAEVLAAAAGLLFAAVVFAVELQIDRAGRLAPLTRFIHRRSGMIPDAAIVLGIVAALGTLGLLIEVGFPSRKVTTIVIATILFLTGFGLALYHFCTVIFNATGRVIDELKRAIVDSVYWFSRNRTSGVFG